MQPDGLRDFRAAATASFNALREDLIDGFARADNGFVEIRGKLDATAAGQQHITRLLEQLIAEHD